MYEQDPDERSDSPSEVSSSSTTEISFAAASHIDLAGIETRFPLLFSEKSTKTIVVTSTVLFCPESSMVIQYMVLGDSQTAFLNQGVEAFVVGAEANRPLELQPFCSKAEIWILVFVGWLPSATAQALSICTILPR